MFTPEQITAILGSPIENVRQNWPLIIDALKRYNIYDRPVCMAAIGTIGVEASGFKPIEEYRNADGSIPDYWYGYDGGPDYHGRGLIQLTHRSNYVAFQAASRYPVVNNPNMLLEPAVSAEAFAWFFSSRPIPDMARQMEWREVRRLVNGGYNGWADFAGYVNVLSVTPNIAEGGGDSERVAWLNNVVGYLTGDVADKLQFVLDELRRHKGA